jgi:hypothetical protein
MKYIITENKLRKFIKKNFNLDLTVHMVTNRWEIPIAFDIYINHKHFERDVNKYGPMYAIKTKSKEFLCQDRSKEGGWIIIDDNNNLYTESKFFKVIGMEPIMSMNDLINAYLEEE